jgi:hypothetical protein
MPDATNGQGDSVVRRVTKESYFTVLHRKNNPDYTNVTWIPASTR